MAPAPRRPGPPPSSTVPASAEPSIGRAASAGVGGVGAKSPAAAADIIMVGCCGSAARRHQAALATMEARGEVIVRAAVDPTENAREEFAVRFPSATGYATLDVVPVPPNALVIVGSAVRHRSAQTVAAFKRGWHVLCEPPLALDPREANQVSAAAHRYERLLAIGLHRRFHPALRYLRTLCRDHLLGPALNFRVSEGGPESVDTMPGWSSHKFEPPEGVLTETGVHTLDLLAWCFGRGSVVRYADDAMGGVEANAFIDLKFPEGVHGTVHLSRDWRTHDTSSFVFERGIVRWNAQHASRLTLQLANAPAALAADLLEPIAASDADFEPQPLPGTAESAVLQLQNVVAAISGHTFLLVPATSAAASAAAVEACYARRTLVEQPWLTHNEAVHARTLALPPEVRRP